MPIKGDLLVVSDSIDNCRFLEDLLSRSNWKVSQFSSPSKALVAIKDIRPAVVILDLPLELMQAKFTALLTLDLETAYVVILPEVNPREVAKFFHKNASDVLMKQLIEPLSLKV